ncbi:copper chaperone PCu(A)C [Paracoccus sp. S3-43]|uniref:copper chaperone PCu(A)C n=1 Tax=Paracoccus sp. S3-43 TaxID=3030011 RepID=UPI0023AF7781|nr:copper chaperone PCu(A)C [Paracoccus sp. S3-43]WEF24846.1 copper chaperone PCu(A)C [Paracoccus sp. S3-43]
MKHFLRNLMLGTVLAALPALALPAHAAHAEVQAGDLTVSGAFARATPPRAPVGGAYLTVTNHGATDDRLVSVTAPVGKAVQMHETAEKDGVMTMRELPDGLPIPAGAAVTMAPAGMHLMLVGLTEPLVEGDTLDMVLHFEKAGDVPVRFDILGIHARGRADRDHAAPAHSARHGPAAHEAQAKPPPEQGKAFAPFDGVPHVEED